MLQANIEARSQIDDIAAAFVGARRAARALADYPGIAPADLAAALAIQDAAIARFDQPIAGWKVGRINSPWQEQLGVNRLPGPIFAAKVQQLPAEGTAVGHVFEHGFGAAEAEFIFRLGAVPPAGGERLSLADTAALVDAVFIGIEVASSPFAGINAGGPLVTISDFGNNNGLIIGPEIADWQNADLDDWPISAAIDGQPVGQGRASAFPDGPLGAVRFLLENLASRGHAIAPGLLVSTGAVTGVHEIAAGQHFSAQFGQYGTIACDIRHADAAA